MRDSYQILGLEKNATIEEIKKAYRLKALKLHPDVNKSLDAHKLFIELNNAYRTLTDPNYNNQKPSTPKSSKTYTPPPPKRDIWGDPIREDPLWVDSMKSHYENPSLQIFKKYKREEKEKEIDLWQKMPKDPISLYWKEYDRLKKETAYEDPEVFWQKLDEFWQKIKKN